MGLLHQLHRHIIHNPLLELDVGISRCHTAGRFEEEPIAELQNIGLMDDGNLAAAFPAGVFKSIADNPLRRTAGNDLDAFRGIGADSVLHPRIEIFGIFAHHNQIDILVQRIDSGIALRRPQVDIEIEFTAQGYIDAAKTGTDGRSQRPLQTDPGLPQRKQGLFRQGCAAFLESCLTGNGFFPVDLHPRCLDYIQSGVNNLGAGAVAPD